VLATENLAKLCVESGNIEHFIYSGSIASYHSGKVSKVIDESTASHPTINRCTPYARAKALTEKLLTGMQKNNNLPLTIIRPGIILGKGTSPYHWGVGMWKWDSICQLWGNGDNPLPFVLVDDVVDAIIKILQSGSLSGESYNLVGDVRISAKDYVRELSKFTNINYRVIPTPIWKYYTVDMFKWLVKN